MAPRARAEGCLTCISRKVKCDGHPDQCLRCKKLALECQWRNNVTGGAGATRTSKAKADRHVTQAGHRRLRAQAACERCRRRKLKCEPSGASCVACVRKEIQCVRHRSPELQATRFPSPVSEEHLQIPRQDEEASTAGYDTSAGSENAFGTESGSVNNSPSSGVDLPSGETLTALVDSYFKHVHTVSCNFFLHFGVFCEAIEQKCVPKLLLLAVCAVSARFTSSAEADNEGRRYYAEARSLLADCIDDISPSNIAALQCLIVYETWEGNFEVVWNLVGIATRMASQLNRDLFLSPQADAEDIEDPRIFIRQESYRRLMWSIFVNSALLGASSGIEEKLVDKLPLPCIPWNFMHGVPCLTSHLDGGETNAKLLRVTHPRAYLIKIIVIWQKIRGFVCSSTNAPVRQPYELMAELRALEESLADWHTSLARTYAFGVRQIYSFRGSQQHDTFLMLHLWYHYCQCELYGTPIRAQDMALSEHQLDHMQASFLADCAVKRLHHAKEISNMVKDRLRVAPSPGSHDVWLSFGVLSSTQVLALQGKQQSLSVAERAEVASMLKANLEALEASKRFFKLSQLIYKECLRLIRDGGFQELVSPQFDDNTDRPRNKIVSSALELHKLYPFLDKANVSSVPIKDALFGPVAGSEARRDSCEAPSMQARSAMAPAVVPPAPGQDDLNWLLGSPQAWLNEWPIDIPGGGSIALHHDYGLGVME